MASNIPEIPVPNVDHVVSEINQLFKHLHSCLEQRRLALIVKYQEAQNEKTARLTTRARKINALSKHKESTERDLQLKELDELQNLMLSEIEVELEKAREPLPETIIVFKRDYLPLEQLIAELGEVLEEEVSLVPNYLSMKPVVAIMKFGNALGELYYPNSVIVDSNNRIFVAEGSAFQAHARISVFSENGEFLTNFTSPHMRQPHGLAIHGDFLYVSDVDLEAILQFKMEPQFSFVTEQGTEGSEVGEFKHPCNLTVSANGNVYVVDYYNHRVQILNSSLQYLRNLTQEQIEFPRDIKLTVDEAYVLCKDSPCVHVFSHAGERLRSLIPRGDKVRMTYPRYFCLDAEENIIISDYTAHRIQIFSQQGNLIKTIGEEGHQPGMFYHPRGLAITKELSFVVVSENSNSALQIFSC